MRLLSYEDYYIKGSYNFQSKAGTETGEFEVLRKGGRDVYCKVLSNGDAVTVSNKTHGRPRLSWPAKFCREELRMNDRDIYLDNGDGGGGIISFPGDPNSGVTFCEPYEKFLRHVKILTDLSHATIKEESGKYILSQVAYGAEQKIMLTVGTNGLINHVEIDANPGKWHGSTDIEYFADNDFPHKCQVKTPDQTMAFQFDEVLTGTVAAERPTTLTLLQNGMRISDNRFQYVNYDVTNGAFLSDEEASAIEAETQKKVKARDSAREAWVREAMAKGAAASAVANDPHNMKDVPVTGESWGNRLRRVPNWAYGGAVVLFLGGWFVAASRRRRK